MRYDEIKEFEQACKIERRDDGIYIQPPTIDKQWCGPYDDAITALRAIRYVFFVE